MAETPGPREAPIRARAVAITLAAAGLALAVGHALQWRFVVDDAFIAFRHVDHLVQGLGAVYNPGERVEGYSSPLWIALLAPLVAAGIRAEVAAVALGALAAAASVALVPLVARRTLGLGPIGSAAAIALLAAQAPWAFWVSGGLEAPLVGLLTLALVPACARLATTGAGAPAAMTVAALLALARPEAVVAPPAVLAVALAARAPLRRIATGAAIAALLVGGHLALRIAYYGHPFANPAYAKGTFGAATAARGLTYLGTWAMSEGGLWVAALAAIGAVALRGRVAMRTALAVLPADAAFIVSVGGDGLYASRFVAHVAPALALVAAAGVHLIAARSHAGALLATVAASTALVAGGRAYPIEDIRAMEDRWERAGEALRRASAPELVLASTVAGKIAYRADRPTLDMLGLCDPVIARTPSTAVGTTLAGHERASPSYVLERGPDVMFLSWLDGAALDDLTRPARVAATLRDSTFFRYAEMVERPEFVARYRPALLAIEGGGPPVALFVRQGARLRADAITLLRWRR